MRTEVEHPPDTLVRGYSISWHQRLTGVPPPTRIYWRSAAHIMTSAQGS